ncbi:hypothetical protein C8Q72DRAFT_867416 [Fomitopsis betulina]|nr:hypothetical protein C8Q72DRAFT_867416 [Fomitopsis betulina]
MTYFVLHCNFSYAATAILLTGSAGFRAYQAAREVTLRIIFCQEEEDLSNPLKVIREEHSLDYAPSFFLGIATTPTFCED